MKKCIFSLTLVAALFAGSAQAADPIRIAVIEPLSGPLAGNGTDIVERFKFLFDKVNATGGIAGRKIEVKGYDNGFDVEKTAQQMRRAADDGVSYVIHGIGPQHAEAIKTFITKHNKRNPGKEMAYLAHSATSNDVTNEKCMYYQAVFDPTVDMKVAALVDSLVSQKRGKKAFLVNPNFEFGQTAEGSMKKFIAKHPSSMEVVGTELIAPFGQVQDFTPLVARIKATGADLIITGNFGPDLTRLANAAADTGLNVQFATLYGQDPSAMVAIGKDRMAKLKTTVVSEYHENDTGGVAALETLNQEYRKTAETSWGIDRYRFLSEMLVGAIQKAGSAKPKDVMKALEGATVATAAGDATMRAEDHQLIQPYFFIEVDPSAKAGAKPVSLLWKGNDVGFAFKTAKVVKKEVMALPTTCKMDRN